jgi:hypothetical protein
MYRGAKVGDSGGRHAGVYLDGGRISGGQSPNLSSVSHGMEHALLATDRRFLLRYYGNPLLGAAPFGSPMRSTPKQPGRSGKQRDEAPI